MLEAGHYLYIDDDALDDVVIDADGLPLLETLRALKPPIGEVDLLGTRLILKP